MAVFEIRSAIPCEVIEDVDSILLEREDVRWSVAEDLLTQEAWIVGMFVERADALADWDTLRPLLPNSGEPVVREIEETDWRESYKLHFKPWDIGRLHWVPVWERETYSIPEDHEVVWLDPGMAFGTGNHETTRLCVERLAGCSSGAGSLGSVIDAGCGSGILAISAAKLGFGPVSGFDNDPEAVRIARENAELNDSEGAVQFSEGDLETGLAGNSADIVLANILANVLVEFAGNLVASVNPGGVLVLSGILATEASDVAQVFSQAAPGWEVDSRVMGEWADVQLRRPNAD